MSYYDIGDSELLYLIRLDNQDAKNFLIIRYKKRIYGLINSFFEKKSIKGLDYEDYFHDCFIVFLKCLKLFDEEYNFYSYVTSAIEKELKKLIKKEINNRDLLSIDMDLRDKDYLMDCVNDCNEVYKETIIKDFISDKLDELDKEIIEYRIKGYSHLEIADILNISKKKIYERMRKIRAEISEFISK